GGDYTIEDFNTAGEFVQFKDADSADLSGQDFIIQKDGDKAIIWTDNNGNGHIDPSDSQFAEIDFEGEDFNENDFGDFGNEIGNLSFVDF
ncbi:MAG: hypothetical protein AAGC56_08915, partial [Pseudomonadota bacterium]